VPRVYPWVSTLGDGIDYKDVVEMRIENLQRRASTAEERLSKVSPTKANLADQLADTKNKLFEANRKLEAIGRQLK